MKSISIYKIIMVLSVLTINISIISLSLYADEISDLKKLKQLYKKRVINKTEYKQLRKEIFLGKKGTKKISLLIKLRKLREIRVIKEQHYKQLKSGIIKGDPKTYKKVSKLWTLKRKYDTRKINRSNYYRAKKEILDDTPKRSSKNQKSEKNFKAKIRLYGSFGYTFGGTTLYERNNDYFDNGYDGSKHNINKLSYGGGIQFIYLLTSDIGLGLDIGAIRLYTLKEVQFRSSGIVYDWDGYKTSITMLNINLFGEFELENILFFQIGLGACFDITDYSNYVSDKAKLGHRFALMTVVGVDIPVSSSISIPIMFRYDIIFFFFLSIYKNTTAITALRLMAGVTFNL